MRTSIRYGQPLANPRSTAGAISGVFSTRSPGTPSARAMPTKSMSGSRSIPTYRSSSAEKPLSARVRCLRIRYDALLKITYTTASDSRAAVQSAWFVYMALPSPTSARTGRSRSASFTPSAAGSPQPMPPPRMPKKLFASAQPKKWRTPCAEEIDSSTITAFAGARLASSWTSVSGWIGTRAASASARRASSARSLSQAARAAPRRRGASGWPSLRARRRTAPPRPGSVARDQERALGVREEPSRLGDRPAVADDPPGHARGRREVEVALGVQDVDREREEDGPRRMRERGLRRAVHDPREVLEAPRLRGPLHEGLGDRRQVGPENRLGDREALVVLPRGQEERGAGLHRVVQHPHRVAQTRRDVDVRRGEPARRLGVAVRHRDGDRFLERQHVVDRGLAREPVHQRELGGPGVAEHHGDAFLLEELEERLLA